MKSLVLPTPNDPEEGRDQESYSTAQAPEDSISHWYSRLTNEDSLQKKRELRLEIAELEDVAGNLDFLLTTYRSANEDEALQIQSIVTHMNATGYVEKFKWTAAQTTDAALFVSLVYALRKAGTPEAKRALLDLLPHHSVPPNRQNTRVNSQARTAIHTALADTVTPQDALWLDNYLHDGVSDLQVQFIIDAAAKFPRKDYLSILDAAYLQAKSPELRERIEALAYRVSRYPIREG